jgi:hypothetical protein
MFPVRCKYFIHFSGQRLALLVPSGVCHIHTTHNGNPKDKGQAFSFIKFWSLLHPERILKIKAAVIKILTNQ